MAQTSAHLVFPAAGQISRNSYFSEWHIPRSGEGHDCDFEVLMLNGKQFSAELKHGSHYRVTSVRVQVETATNQSTQIVGIGNCPGGGAATAGFGFGTMSRYLRGCHDVRRSPVGGMLDVTFRIPNPIWVDTEDESSDEVAMLVLGYSAPVSVENSHAWFSVMLECEFLQRHSGAPPPGTAIEPGTWYIHSSTFV